MEGQCTSVNVKPPSWHSQLSHQGAPTAVAPTLYKQQPSAVFETQAAEKRLRFVFIGAGAAELATKVACAGQIAMDRPSYWCTEHSYANHSSVHPVDSVIQGTAFTDTEMEEIESMSYSASFRLEFYLKTMHDPKRRFSSMFRVSGHEHPVTTRVALSIIDGTIGEIPKISNIRMLEDIVFVFLSMEAFPTTGLRSEWDKQLQALEKSLQHIKHEGGFHFPWRGSSMRQSMFSMFSHSHHPKPYLTVLRQDQRRRTSLKSSVNSAWMPLREFLSQIAEKGVEGFPVEQQVDFNDIGSLIDALANLVRANGQRDTFWHKVVRPLRNSVQPGHRGCCCMCGCRRKSVDETLS